MRNQPRRVLLQLMLILYFIDSCFGERSSYGESCSKVVRCDRRSLLGCLAGKCECVKPDEMIFEAKTGKCASKAGERCKYAFEDSEGNQAFEVMNCVENSQCGEDGFCSCNPEFYENSNGTCSPSNKHGEFCDQTVKCSVVSGLTCSKANVCECNELSAHSEREEQCVGLVRKPCISFKCIENASCSNNICICDSEYYEESASQCSKRIELNGNCSEDAQCRNEGGFPLKCIEGVCKCDPSVSTYGSARRHQKKNWCCDSGFYQYEDTTATHCLGKVSKPCIRGYCAKGAYCAYTNAAFYARENYEGTCRCLSNYYESPTGSCGVGHFSYCASAGVCLDGLVCDGYNSRCRCKYSQEYVGSKCVSRVGGPCDEFSGCILDADCVNIGTSSRGSCQCKAGYVEIADGSCQVEYGQPCSKSKRCEVAAGLTCAEEVCQCDGFKEYNPSTRKCLGLAGALCDVTEKNSCIENSACSRIRPESEQGHCRCLDGFQLSENYTCEPEPGRLELEALIPILSLPVVYETDDSNVIDSDVTPTTLTEEKEY